MSQSGLFSGKCGYLQSSNHHPWRSPAENGEESEVLQVNKREREEVNRRAQLAECEVPAQRAEQRQKSPVGKCQTRRVNRRQRCAARQE